MSRKGDSKLIVIFQVVVICQSLPTEVSFFIVISDSSHLRRTSTSRKAKLEKVDDAGYYFDVYLTEMMNRFIISL